MKPAKKKRWVASSGPLLARKASVLFEGSQSSPGHPFDTNVRGRWDICGVIRAGQTKPECLEKNLIQCNVASGNNVQKLSASTRRKHIVCATNSELGETLTQQHSDTSKKIRILEAQPFIAVYGINRTFWGGEPYKLPVHYVDKCSVNEY